MVMYAKVGCAKCTFKTILANHAQKLRYIFDLIFRLRILDYYDFHTFKIYIPIFDIHEIDRFEISSNIASVYTVDFTFYQELKRADKMKEYFKSSLPLKLDYNREENLSERIQKTIENLKTYCPKPKSNEAF